MSQFNNDKNLSMLMDFYELTMSNGYFSSDHKDTEVVFDMFYRKNPDNGGYVIFAGLDLLIQYIEDLSFKKEDIEFLKSLNIFDIMFLNYLEHFKFNGDIYSIEEGTPVFPYEPLITIKANIIEAQLIETMLLLCINYSSLIATKARRMVNAAKGITIMEFGSRRAQGFDAAIIGTRSAYIGGIDLTANVLANQLYNIKAVGTMAHSWVQLFDSEYDAFKTYATTYPDECTLLIDTYSVMDSGLKNAIRIHEEVLKQMGKSLKGIRIDSGDLAYLSKKIRKELDKHGMQSTQICISNSLDEYLIKSLLEQEASVNSFGVGERLITAKSDPVFGGVYKLAAVIKDGVITPKIKISENIEKITNPGHKKLYRVIDDNDHAIADLITLDNEVINTNEPLTLFDQNQTWKKLVLKKYKLVQLHQQIYNKGELVYKRKSVQEIRVHSEKQLALLYPEVKRFENPQTFYVDLSLDLYNLKISMLNK